MARQKSDILSGLGTSFEIIKRLSEAVHALGGSDDDLRKMLVNGDLTHDVAQLLRGTARLAPNYPEEIFTLTIDWEGTLETIHSRCNLDMTVPIFESDNTTRYIPRPPQNSHYRILRWNEDMGVVARVKTYCHQYKYDWALYTREFLTYVAGLPRSYCGSVTTLESMYYSPSRGGMCPYFFSDGVRRVLDEVGRNDLRGEVIKAGVGVLVRLK